MIFLGDESTDLRSDIGIGEEKEGPLLPNTVKTGTIGGWLRISFFDLLPTWATEGWRKQRKNTGRPAG